ncbi:MAG TPA: type II toxin-antitoxin system YafQ family toxin [Gammaproteobacteria bacterium]|nr:type II toxin-antitoxin system YafQ family toxin [Gammaproteobacteria bacterium]
MFEPVYTRRFEKDLKLARKRGKNIQKLKDAIEILLGGSRLPEKYHDHWLVGNYSDRRECHIEPDWLLIYKPEKREIVFERLGSHADLFG